MKQKTWVEISQSALRHNLGEVRKLVNPAKVMAVVKANAYGHGFLEIAQLANKNGADWFGVDQVDEAMVLRKAGIKKPVLILGYTPLERIRDAVKNNISFVAYQAETLKEAARVGTKKRPARIHLKLETGLTRQGIASQDLMPLVHLIQKLGSSIVIEGASTHYANIDDTSDATYAYEQLSRFRELIAILREHGIDPPWKHTACSTAAFLFPEMRFNLIRLGISLYGLWSSERTKFGAKTLKLKAVLTWKTLVAQIKKIPSGTSVGYGLTERVKRDSIVAVIPIGYADGFDRMGMSRKGEVLIRGKRCKVLGRVCMNMCMVDVTSVNGVRTEDEVVIIGCQGKDEIAAEDVADHCGTNNYEVVSRISALIKRTLVD